MTLLFIIFLFLQLSSYFPSDTKQTSIVTHVLHTYDWGSSILLCVLLAVMQGLCVSITQAAVQHWAGWIVYGIVVLTTFLVIKTVNFRLHRALDMNPEEEEEEEGEGKKEGEEGESEDGGKGESGGEGDRKELGLDGKVVEPSLSKAEEAGVIILPGQVSQGELEGSREVEEGLQHHRDSASTLGQSSTYHSSQETAELQVVASTEGGGEGGGGGETAVQSLLGLIEAEVEVRRGGREEEGEESPTGERAEGTVVVQVESGSGSEPGQKPTEGEKSSDHK